MRIAVISDIHGNLEALNQVLVDLDGANIHRVICLGDSLGYGPEPEAVVNTIRAREIPAVLGNHELAMLDPAYCKRLNPATRESVRITRTLISESTSDYCRSLPKVLEQEGALFVHGSPPDSVTRYLFRPSTTLLGKLFASFSERFCFVGHTHDLGLFVADGPYRIRIELCKGRHPLNHGRRYIVNVGSVGQPRDGNNNAKYVIWDQEAEDLEVRFVPYDIKSTADRIIALGFPEFNATRLWGA